MPVYRVSAEICNASRLAPNNEVRIGGNRVGVVESIETVELEDPERLRDREGRRLGAAAKLNLKLDESAKPLPEDSTIRVRYRSSFGLKYLEIDRGDGDGPAGGRRPSPARAGRGSRPSSTTSATPSTPSTREASRKVLEGFGSGLRRRAAAR